MSASSRPPRRLSSLFLNLSPPTTALEHLVDPSLPFTNSTSQTTAHPPPKTPTLQRAKDLVPFVNWFRKYDWKRDAKGDVCGGLAVAVMVIPQGMAYATLASLPPEYGLYSYLVPIATYVFFGTSRHLAIGPVALNYLFLTTALTPLADPVQETAKYVNMAIWLTLMSGLISLAMGLLNMGYAVTFLAPSVITGFTSGCAATISVSQLEPLLGFTTKRSPYAIIQLYRILSELPLTKLPALLLGLTSIFTVMILKRYRSSIPSNLLVVVFGTLFAYLLALFAPDLFLFLPVVGFVPTGLPGWSIPSTEGVDVWALMIPATLLAILGFMQSIAVAKRYAEKFDYEVNASQELVALGLAHIFGFFFSSADATGSLSRTAVNAESGARSQLSSAFTLIVVIVSLLWLTPVLYYIPKSALAAIILCSVSSLYDVQAYKHLWNIKRRDFTVAIFTAMITFGLTIQMGLLVGIAASLLAIINRSSRPPHAILGEIGCKGVYRNVKRYTNAVQYPGIMIFRFDASIFFANRAYFRHSVIKLLKVYKSQNRGFGDEGTIDNGRNEHDEISTTTVVVVPSNHDGTLNESENEDVGSWRQGIQPKNTGKMPGPSHEETNIGSSSTPTTGTPTTLGTGTVPLRFIVMDFSPVNDIDSAGLATLFDLQKSLRTIHGIRVLFAGVKGTVRDALWKAGRFDFGGSESFGETVPSENRGGADKDEPGERRMCHDCEDMCVDGKPTTGSEGEEESCSEECESKEGGCEDGQVDEERRTCGTFHRIEISDSDSLPSLSVSVPISPPHLTTSSPSPQLEQTKSPTLPPRTHRHRHSDQFFLTLHGAVKFARSVVEAEERVRYRRISMRDENLSRRSTDIVEGSEERESLLRVRIK